MITPILTRVVEAEKGKVVLAKINVDQNPKSASKYGITALPTVIRFQNGRETGRFLGAKSEPEIRKFIQTN